MSGIRQLSYFAIGKETTKGTPVAATIRLSPDLNSAFRVDWMKTYHEGRRTGLRNPITYSTRQGEMVEVSYRTLSDTGVAFDELPYFFHFPAGGTAGSGTTAVTWGWQWGGTATGTALAYTIEFGDDVQCYEAEYGQVRRLRLSGDSQGMTQLEADFFARQSTKTTATSLSTVDDVRIPSYLWTAAFATAGSGLAAATAIPNFLREWEAEWTTGLTPHFYADGNDYFGKSVEGAAIEGSVRLVVDSNATAVSRFYDKGEAGTKDFLRLAASGPAIGGGTAYQAILEYALDYQSVIPLGSEIEGVNTYEITAKLVDDVTWGKSVGATVVCNLASL